MVTCRTVQEAVDLLHYCLEDGEVAFGSHFRQEMTREQVSLEDAWTVLRKGRIYDPPEHDIKSGEYKYRVEGHEPGGKGLAVVFSFKTVEKAFLITMFSI